MLLTPYSNSATAAAPNIKPASKNNNTPRAISGYGVGMDAVPRIITNIPITQINKNSLNVNFIVHSTSHDSQDTHACYMMSCA